MADGTVLAVMVLMTACSVDICSISFAVMAVFGYAQTMLRTLPCHIVFMHERKKPCKHVAQRKQNMVDS